MSVSGGIQGLHFVNTMSNTDLRRKSAEAEGIIGGLGNKVKNLNVWGPLAAAGVIFGKISQEAYEFENKFSKAMREVQTISQAVQDDFEGIGDSIVNMAANGPDNAIQLAEAYYQIVSAGYDGAEGLNLLETASKAATAGLTDTETAADGLTTVLNAWGKDASEATAIADAFFKTVERGKTTFGELASNIAQVAPLAAANNITENEIFAAIQTITKQGTSTSEAVTQIRSAIIGMNQALGDGWSETMTFQEGLQAVRDMADGSQNKLKELLGRVEGVNATLAMTGENAKGAANDLQETTDAVDAMQSAYDKMLKEADNKWSMVHNKWTREIRDIGKALKVSSVGIADFFNAILANANDIPDTPPIVGGMLDRVEAYKMMGYNAAEAYGRAAVSTNRGVQSMLWGVMNSAKEGFGNRQGRLSEIMGIEDTKKRAEELNSFLEKMQKERTFDLNVFSEGDNQGELAEHLRTKYWDDLFSKIETGIKKVNEAGGEDDIFKPKTVADALTRIDELKEKLGTGTVEQEFQLRLDIADEQEFVDEFAQRVNEKLREALSQSAAINVTGPGGKNTQIETLKEIPKLAKEGEKAIEGQLEPMETLTKEEEKRLKAQAEYLSNMAKQKELTEDLAQGFDDASRILGAMSFAIGEFDSDIGRALGKMADLAYNASNLFTQIGTGNIPGAIASGIGILGNIFSVFSNGTEDVAEFNQELYKTQKLLDSMGGALDSLPDSKWFEYAKIQVADLNKQMDDFINQKFPYGTFGVDDLESVILYYQKLAELQGGLNDYQQEQFEKFLEWYNEAAELRNEEYSRRLGFEPSTISDGILQGVQDGLELSGNELGDWADNFGELIKKALTQNILTALNERYLSNFMERFNEAMRTDGLSDTERDELTKLYIDSVRGAESMWEQIQPIISDYTTGDNQSGLTGAIKGITEETAGLIAGQFTAMRYDLTDMNSSMLEQLEVAAESLEVLEDIRDNTAHNMHLVNINKNLDEMNAKIQADL